jgi:uncharacterized membrane protein
MQKRCDILLEMKLRQSNSEQSGQSEPLKVTLLKSPEGRLLLSGVALAFIYTFWLGVKLLFSAEDSQVLVGMTATQILFGRAAGMAFGYQVGLDNATVILICMIIETVLVLIFYPLFVFSWRHLLVIRWLKRFFDRTRKSAEARKDLVRKYGIIGLFVFVWFPFWMTGPVVGSVIGFMLGLQLWLNMTVVLAGTYVAIFGWAFFLRQFQERSASFSSYAATVLMALLIIIIFIGHLLHRTLKQNKQSR